MTITTLLYILALICFIVAAFGLVYGKVSFIALGLAILTLSLLVSGITIGTKP